MQLATRGMGAETLIGAHGLYLLLAVSAPAHPQCQKLTSGGKDPTPR